MPKLLVALDGSPFADAAVPVAVGLARALGASLELVAVYEQSPRRFATGGAPMRDHTLDGEVADRIRSALRTHLETLRDRIRTHEHAPEVLVTVLTGAPADMLVAHAEREEAALIVLTTHARSGLSRAWIGSVTEAVLRSSHVPVVAVRPGEKEPQDTWSLARMLVPLDGSEASEQVFSALRARFGRTVEYIIMRAVTPLHPMLRSILSAQEYDRDLTEQRDLVAEYLRTVASRYAHDDHRDEPAGISITHCAHVNFEPADAIADCAAASNVDLIALGTHARGAVGRFLLGSVADKVLRTADRPVLLYRISDGS
jgi:nucleotide-binding universal stress UspA family protein